MGVLVEFLDRPECSTYRKSRSRLLCALSLYFSLYHTIPYDSYNDTIQNENGIERSPTMHLSANIHSLAKLRRLAESSCSEESFLPKIRVPTNEKCTTTPLSWSAHVQPQVGPGRLLESSLSLDVFFVLP